MKILITLQRRRTHRYLISLLTKSLISQLKALIAEQEYAKAMDLVYHGGLLEREIPEEELPSLQADLLLSDRCANWDIVK